MLLLLLPLFNSPVSGAELPVHLDFNAGVPGTVADASGQGTGFEVVAPFSGARLSEDGAPSDASRPWYEPSRLSLTNGQLKITTNKGIAFQSNNNQLNVLSISADGSKGLVAEATLVRPYYGTSSQQAGVWVGLNDHTYIKLVVNGNRVELQREINDVSAGSGSTDQRQTSYLSGLNTQTVRLRLVVDAATGKAEGFYSTDGVNYKSTGAGYTEPWLSVYGTGLISSQVLCGVLSTHRNAGTPITYTFDDFSLSALVNTTTSELATQDVKINFQLASTFTPSGYTADAGQAYSSDRGYGWVDPVTGQPKDQTASMRERTGTEDVRLRTFAQMQATTNGQTPGSWEYALPNGVYNVTVSAGDPDYYDSKHQVNVEGVAAITGFVPTKTVKYRTGTVTVEVKDGKLTIDAAGGQNTKLNYVLVSPVPALAFSTDTLSYTVVQGGAVSPQSTELSANVGAPAVSLGKPAGADWLTLPAAALGTLTFGPENISTSLTPGTYRATVAASADGYTSDSLRITLTITAPPAPASKVNINFQLASTSTPSGYVGDAGLAFDVARGYGWVDPVTGQPKDQTASMRERTGTEDVRLRTFAQMQATTNGQTPGSWEYALPNGVYNVTVSAGDPDYYDSKHQVNVEGVAAITGFVPTKTVKYRTGTVTVEVKDGKLTIDAAGGQNTKLNYALISPSVQAVKELSFSPVSLDFTADKGVAVTGQTTKLSASTGTPAVSLSKSTGADWLTLPAAALGTLTFGPENINTNLTPGTYQATVTASATGYTSADLHITLTVTQPASAQDINVNFQLAGSATPEGYVAETGLAFDTFRGYGWVDPVTGQPKDQTASMRERTGTEDVRLRTLAQMQATTSGQTPGSWEYVLPSGTYNVTVSAGDPDYIDSKHQVNVEGVPAISGFVPSKQDKYRINTVTVEVKDGRLTIDATGGQNTKLNYVLVAQVPESELMRPRVTAVRPADDATDVALDESVSVDLEFPSGVSLDGSTVNPNTVKLYTIALGGGEEVSGTAVNTTGGGDAITLSATLKPSTTYEFQITDQVKDMNGNPMVAFSSRFTTTSNTPETPTDLAGVSFTEITLIDNDFGAHGFTSLVIGPDHRLYATTSQGKIERWDINPDGTITNHITIAPFGDDRRLLIGLRFDPAATATNLVAWITHSAPQFMNAPDWSGKVSKIILNTPLAPQVIDYVVNLPRSYKDHSTNGIDFGPDGALYFVQGSNSGMGAPDGAWGNRPERLLNAAVLRLDVNKADQMGLPIDVKTEEGGTYNPYAADAPLTLYATGVRNAYDLVWHSNGQLYVATNGSAAGSNTPALNTGSVWSNGQQYTGPTIEALSNVRDTQGDFLFRVQKGGYYGHPNELRHEYIMGGGNPTEREDPNEVVWTINGVNYGYPVGTPTEPNYRGWAYDFGLNISPNGAIEYKSNAFDGALKGKLMVCRFSGGDDIIVLEPGVTNTDIIRATEGIKVPGLRRPFSNPLDVIEDVYTGNLYLSEYYDGNGDGRPRITLLKADKSAVSATQSISNALKAAAVDTAVVADGYEMRVWPNPSTGDRVQVELHGFRPHEAVKVMMYDVAGQEVQSRSVETDGTGAVITELPVPNGTIQGVYLVRAASPSGKAQGKLVVVR
ncbi:Ig-like domain-containing protein [Pontibacter sp. 172403-2]|uniref:Ig-like domain-containing protein n=1 Tax=Pontibacter rufus TaxID=2791028 RepID=UPI0018AFCE1F|nr:Ig-like domain-containing protein [Pontibacter sp. 172403-2]MBF9254589.1 Ig-like domain-containing protein [Pontibacter sp. 172403-2]